MQNEKTLSEKIDDPKEEIKLNPILKNRAFAWLLFGVSFALMLIGNFFNSDVMVGGWDIVIYFLLLTPLAYMVWKKELKNPYIKWFFPLLLLMMVDMFYYNNDLVQFFVPTIFYIMVIILYLNSMQKVHSFYQTLIPRLELPFRGITYIRNFLETLLVKEADKKLYGRIFVAILITVPFLVLFVALLFSADKNFEIFLTNIVDIELGFSTRYFLTVPLYFFFYLFLFIYGFSNHKDRTSTTETKSLDMLIVGIFLGMINLLFMMFIAIQLPFLFGEPNLPANTTLAEFAREGFFQLMMVMGIVLLIFLFIMRRYKGEKIATFFLGGLLVQTSIMGLLSLKKMYLYQSIKGATVMRYYVEWFDYFLIAVLLLGLVFLVRTLAFTKLLNMVAILARFSFGLVISLNVDGMVASHNIEKFKDKPESLDKVAISRLSIDALPAVEGTDIVIETYRDMRDCSDFSDYHFGYCSKISKYGISQYRKYVYVDDYIENPYLGLTKERNVSEIYKSCAGCHGINGEQKALGKSAIIRGQDVNKTIEQLQAYKRGNLNLHGMGGLMKGQVAGLDDENIEALAFYISELKMEENNDSK